MAIQEIRVGQTERDTRGEGVLGEVKRTIGIPGLEKVRTTKVYRLEGVTKREAGTLAEKLFCEPIDQEFTLNKPLITDTQQIVEVAYKPGVMNPEAASIVKVANDLGIYPQAVDSSTEYGFYGDVSREQVDQAVGSLLMNKTVERVVEKKPETLIIKGEPGAVNIVPLRISSEEQLMTLSKDKLFLNLEEMQIIQVHFNELGRDPTDCELEIIAARWSEHCGHKTFKAKVIVDGVEKQPLFTRIRETSEKYFGDLIVSAFEDNSGVMRFYEDQAICAKVETHNSPSAIEPYGGAMTGSGGVFRDIMGTGQGAKVIISTDMFCFAPPDLDPTQLPPGTLHPDYLQRRVIAGVRDYGNRMGIPTNNGSVHYHEDFRAKPTIIVGSDGIIPENMAKKGSPEVGDLVIAIGGRTGRDGIHGATFSSGEMTDRTINVNSSAVQIGNAIEEKRMSDALLEARDRGLIRAITDCGAAGFSSAIGELGEDVGVTVDVSKIKLKYPGLLPWEIWLSESQERMVAAIDPNKKEDFLAICRKYNVESIVLGHFDGTGKLTVKDGDEIVADLNYEFLKHGLPQRTMKAHYEKLVFEESEIGMPTDWDDVLRKILSHGNVCSKEPIVRQYDHQVQGTNVLPPFSGVNHDGPNDAVVITPILGKAYGMVTSHGMNPILNRIDPYWGSVWATAEAMANYVAVGGNPDEAALINNYIWPFPDEEAMGSLDKSVDAVVDCMNALERPVVSGKDSLSSTYRGKNGEVIKIPPVLCMSVFGRIPDVRKTVTSDIKTMGSKLYLVGALDREMGGSTYYDINGLVGNEVPRVDLKILPKVLRGVHEAIKTGEVLACHDVSEGGVIGSISEMAFGGDCGVKLNLDSNLQRPDMFLFNETAGTFVVEVKDSETAEKLFGNLPHMELGETTQDKKIIVKTGEKELFTASTDELKQAWKQPMKAIFG
ncbi:MAG: phosphoribosylformylglycinamidine synthase subunit PurL [Candidatus Levybacteria bacterium]|nr:phosphoribosylformylglycinamidine synthase subunit PurL [Candidatus Levybacteria bacterium]